MNSRISSAKAALNDNTDEDQYANCENIDMFSVTFISGSGEHSKVYSAKIRRNKSTVPPARVSRVGIENKMRRFHLYIENLER